MFLFVGRFWFGFFLSNKEYFAPEETSNLFVNCNSINFIGSRNLQKLLCGRAYELFTTLKIYCLSRTLLCINRKLDVKYTRIIKVSLVSLFISFLVICTQDHLNNSPFPFFPVHHMLQQFDGQHMLTDQLAVICSSCISSFKAIIQISLYPTGSFHSLQNIVFLWPSD